MGRIKSAVQQSAVIIAIPLLLGGCAVSTPVTVTPTVVELQTANAVEFPAPAGATGDLRSQWRAALQAAFASRSVNIQQGAPFLADFALSIRNAETGIATVSDNSKDIDWQSQPRRNRLLDKCKAQRMRGTLVIFRRANGSIIYRGESETDACRFGSAELTVMANELVDNAIN